MFSKLCDDGKMIGCSHLGELYEYGAGVAKDTQKAISLYQKACDNDELLGCLGLAGLLIEGKIITKDIDKAKALVQKACDSDDLEISAVGCFSVIGLIKDGKKPSKMEVMKYIPMVAEKAQKSCENDEMLGCGIYGFILDYFEEDYKKAFDIYKKACDGGESSSCTEMANMYNNGKGVEKNYKKANELYKIACDDYDFEACRELATNYKNGDGIRQDYKKAAELYQKACDNDEYEACNNLGVMYDDGEGVDKSAKKAMELYKKACDSGEAMWVVKI